MVASTTFYVGNSREDLANERRTAEQPFLLPGDGGPGRTTDGDDVLRFLILAPNEEGVAEARVNFYFHDALIQSYLIIANVGTGSGGFLLRADYTVSARLDDLLSLPYRPRTSILLNDGYGDTHTLVLRPSQAEPSSEIPVPISLPAETVGPLVDQLHRALAASIFPGRRSKRQLVEDLRRVAPVGRDLHRKLFVQAPDLFGSLHSAAASRPLISIHRPRNVTFTLPWNALYAIGLPRDVLNTPICPLIDEWDERTPLVDTLSLASVLG